MKKIVLRTVVLLFSISLLNLSCSKENEGSNDNTSFSAKVNQNELDKAKELFKDMIKTQDYISYRSFLMIFVDKMNGNKVLFQTKPEYMDWISSNLSKTKFSSKEEFSEMFDEFVQKQYILESKNVDLYNYLKNADQSQFLEIVHPSLGTIPLISMSTPCQDDCISQCEYSMNGNEWGYSLDYNIGGGAIGHAMATEIYWSNYKTICDNLSNCIYNC